MAPDDWDLPKENGKWTRIEGVKDVYWKMEGEILKINYRGVPAETDWETVTKLKDIPTKERLKELQKSVSVAYPAKYTAINQFIDLVAGGYVDIPASETDPIPQTPTIIKDVFGFVQVPNYSDLKYKDDSPKITIGYKTKLIYTTWKEIKRLSLKKENVLNKELVSNYKDANTRLAMYAFINAYIDGNVKENLAFFDSNELQERRQLEIETLRREK